MRAFARSSPSVSPTRSTQQSTQLWKTHCNSPPSFGDYGAQRVRRFPYGIFFELQQSRILVIACFHGSRDPKHWQAR